MNEIWANRLIAGTKTWAQVPASRKNNVKAILINRVNEKEITQDKYEEIVGEPFPAPVTE